MKAQEFYDKDKGNYFTYDGEKVKVIGNIYDNKDLLK